MNSINYSLLVSCDLNSKNTFSTKLSELLKDFSLIEIENSSYLLEEFKSNQNLKGIILTYTEDLKKIVYPIR